MGAEANDAGRMEANAQTFDSEFFKRGDVRVEMDAKLIGEMKRAELCGEGKEIEKGKFKCKMASREMVMQKAGEEGGDKSSHVGRYRCGLRNG